jgi:hypothetical protein
MKILLLILLFSSFGLSAMAKDQAFKKALEKYPEFSFARSFSFNEKTCQNIEGPYLSAKDYDFNEYKEETTITYYASREVLRERYKELTSGPKRLKKRLYYDGQDFLLPTQIGSIKVTKDFLNKIAHQVEMALEIKSAELIFYPDMGHAHLYLPQDLTTSSLEDALRSPDLVSLFHTAEQLMMKDGKAPRDSKNYRQLRYRTRNLVGHFDNSGALEMVYAFENKSFNTIHNIAALINHKRKFSTLYFSAHPEGCVTFNFQGKKIGLDLSLYH